MTLHLLAVATSKLVHPRSRAITSPMANLFAVDALYVDSICTLAGFLRTAASSMAKL